MGRNHYILWVLLAPLSWGACVSVTGTLRLANTAPYNGTLTISWPVPWIAADGTVMPAGPPITTNVQGGSLSVCLEANLPASSTQPNNTFYSVAYRPTLTGATPEIWLVPSSGPADISTVRQSQPAPTPASLVNLTQLSTAGASSGQGICLIGGVWAPGNCGNGFTSPMTTLGDMIYENSSPGPARLAGNTSSSKQVLTQTGTGSASAAPAWGAVTEDTFSFTNITTANATTSLHGLAPKGSGNAGDCYIGTSVFAPCPSANVVSSVFGRIGAVVSAIGDYTAAQVTNAFDTSNNNSLGAHWEDYTDISTPTSPISGRTRTYTKSGKFCSLDPMSNENCIGLSAPVLSVFSRTGAVTAQSGDYTCAQVTNCSTSGSAQSGATITLTETSSSNSTYTFTMSPSLTAYPSGAGQIPVWSWKVGTTCSGGAVTGNVNALGAHAIVEADGSNPTAIHCASGQKLLLTYDSVASNFVILGGEAQSASASPGTVLVEQHTSTGTSTSLDFTSCITSTYDEYLIEGVGITFNATANGSDLALRVSTNGGSSFQATSYGPDAELIQSTNGAGLTSTANNATTYIPVALAVANSTTVPAVFSIRLFSPLSTSLHKMTLVHTGYPSNMQMLIYDAESRWASTTAVNAFQLIPATSGGTSSMWQFATGTVRCYGIAH